MLINGIGLLSYLTTPVTLTFTLPVKSEGTAITIPPSSLTVTFNPIALASKSAATTSKEVVLLLLELYLSSPA